VRICDEVMGVNAWGFTNRGFDTVIEPALGMPLCETTCVSCGQCVSSCPTGSLTPRSTHLPKQGPWDMETVSTVCPYCGIGCDIELGVVGDKIAEVTSSLDSVVNSGNLCRKGSYNHVCSADIQRLKTPLIKQDGKLVAADWKKAIALASEGLRQVGERSGGDRLAVLVSPQMTNEECYLAQKLARAALGTNNIGSLGVPAMSQELARSLGQNASTCSYNDILDSDLILTFGSDLDEDYPITGLQVRQAVDKGSRLLMFEHRPTRMDTLAKTIIKVNPRRSAALLKAILNYLITYDLTDKEYIASQTEGFNSLVKEMKRYPLENIADSLWVKPTKIIDALHLYLRAQRPVIIIDADTISAEDIILITDLALLTGNIGRKGAGIIALHSGGNAQGLIDMGITSDYLPGQQLIADAAVRDGIESAWGKPLPSGEGRGAIDIVEGIERGEIHGVLLLGGDAVGAVGDAILEVPVFSVLVDTALPDKPPYSDVVLPGATFAESEGTYTNCERRIQRLHRAIAPPGGKANWEIIASLSGALGYPMKYRSVAGIEREISRLLPVLKAGKKAGGYPKAGAQWPFLRRGKFDLKHGLERLRLAESGGYPASGSLSRLP